MTKKSSACELARMAEDCGLAAVALHARTREMGYSGNARWEWIAAVKDAVKIPVIGNGDIRSPEDACAMVTQTGCDAVMIGRIAPSNPWIFRQIEQYCAAIAGADAVVRPRAKLDCCRHSVFAADTSIKGMISSAIDAHILKQALAAEGPIARVTRAERRTVPGAATKPPPYDHPTESRPLPDDPHLLPDAD